MKNQKLAMFDWNGTLLDDAKIAHGAVCKIFQRFNLTAPSFEKYREEITPDIVSFYYQNGIPTSCTLADMNIIFKPIIEERWKEVELSQYANPLIRCCEEAGMPRVLITMENPTIIQRRLKQFKLQDKFQDVIARASDKAACMRTALATFGVQDHKEAFYLGDTASDIEASKEVGVVSIAYTGGYNSRKKLKAAKPDYLVDGLWELIVLLSKHKSFIEIGW